MDIGAIFPSPCHPSPDHGIANAFDIVDYDNHESLDIEFLKSEIKQILAEKQMTGRVSSWPVSVFEASLFAGVDYAVEWINGNVPKEEIYEDRNGKTHDNYWMFLMDYITY